MTTQCRCKCQELLRELIISEGGACKCPISVNMRSFLEQEREVQRLLQSWFKTTCIVFYNNISAGHTSLLQVYSCFRAPFIPSQILLHHYLAKVVHHSKMRTFINAKCKYETRGSSLYTLTDLSFSESEISSSKWHGLVQILFKGISKTLMTQVM